MKNNTMKKQITTALFAVAGLLLSTAASHAITYNVDLKTASLAGLPAEGPYYLDFQFATGSGAVGNNTISISNFNFTGGSATGSASLFGTASGSLTSGVTLKDSPTPSELYQQFTTGTSDIGFTVNTTLNVDAGLTPDMFSVAILDSSLGYPAQIFTTAPDTASLITETITSATSLNLGLYHGVGPADGSSSGSFAGVTASVPDSGSTLALFGFALLGFAGFRRKSASLQ